MEGPPPSLRLWLGGAYWDTKNTAKSTVVAPPWESVYFSPDRLVFQQETFQVRAWYTRFGLQSANHNKEPDDHISVELEFVAHLAELGLRALQACDRERFHETPEAQSGFLAEAAAVVRQHGSNGGR